MKASEPVAWRTHYPSGWEYKDGNPPFELKGNSQLLYTHPAELTDEVKDVLMDALSGWKYIRQCHGDLYGVGWDRVQEKIEAILRKASEK
jgi:hypothetical protein